MDLPPRLADRKKNATAFPNGNGGENREPEPAAEELDAAIEAAEPESPVHASQPAGFSVAKFGGKALKKMTPADLAARVQGSDEENLPVLQAFQQFLEVERQRARRAMGFLSLCFVAVIIVVTCIGFFIGKMMYNSMQRDIAKSRQEIEKAGAEIAKTSSEIATIKALVDSETQRLNSELEDGKHRFDVAKSGIQMLDSKISGTLGDVTSLKTDLAKIEEAKTDSIKLFADRLEGLAAKIDSLSEENASLREKILSIHVAPAETAVRRSAYVESIPFSVASPSNTEETVNWRLPMPEP